MGQRELSPGEWAVLALVCEGEVHGWAVVRALAPSGEVGRVWSVTRPLVYRALEVLGERGLVEGVGNAKSDRGPNRMIVRATQAGRKAVRAWLREPVAHVRDARSLLLLKLLFVERAGGDAGPLLTAQSRVLAGTEAALESQLAAAEGSSAMLAAFRLEATRAVARFVERFLVSV